jgi:hypothetical protein
MSDEKINAYALQLESKQKMKSADKNLRKKLADITGDGRTQRQAMMEAFGIQDSMESMLTNAATNIGTQAAQDMFFGDGSNPIGQIAEHEARNMPYMTGNTKPVVHGDWQLQTILKETRVGKEVERFRVTNAKTGQKFDYQFRHANAASMVAAALNESNNTNDPRVSRIIEWCNTEESIMMETAKLVQHYKQVDPGNTKRRDILKNKISEKKLMLEGIRSKMGAL